MKASFRTSTAAALVALLAALTPLSAAAQEVDSETLAAAQALHGEAIAALDAKDFATACPKLERVVQMIPQGLQGAGRLLAFDNGGSAGYPAKFRDFSRVVEIDPLANALQWTYSATRSGFVNWSFFSSIVSSAQRLGEGNTLISEGTKGRIFEITSNGDIVWEYMSPFTDVTTNTGRPVVSYLVYRAYRLPFYWPFFPAPPNGGV